MDQIIRLDDRPWTVSGVMVPGFFVLVAFLASYVPARRASLIQPIRALKGD